MMKNSLYGGCRLCPRNCGTDRTLTKGFCGAKSTLRAARAALHYYEEPFLSGESGSGAVFFSGCSLKCVFCQNSPISDGFEGDDISTERLSEIFFELEEQGALNINLVTGTHFTPDIAKALKIAKANGLKIPVLWNSSGYELPETLELLEGLVDIYLPDFKTLDPALAKKYMNAPDYPERAKAALEHMTRSIKKTVPKGFLMDESEGAKKEFEEGLMKKGVCVRHLVLPGSVKDSKNVIRYLYETYGDSIWISVMSQYTPMGNLPFQELNRKVTRKEYDEVVDFAIDIGVTNCMIQEGNSVGESFIPAFDGTGIRKKNENSKGA